MHRRDALAALPALVPVAGCLGAVGAPGAGVPDPYREPCPSFAEDADRTVCYRREGRERPPLVLSPEDDPLVVGAGGGPSGDADDSASDDGSGASDGGGTSDDGGAGEASDSVGVVDAVSFVLRNGTARPFRFNPYAWALWRRTADGCAHVAPDAVRQPLLRLAPGGTHRWSLSATAHPSPRDADAATVDADVSPGVHAFAVDGRLGDGPRVECVVRFEVVRRGER